MRIEPRSAHRWVVAIATAAAAAIAVPALIAGTAPAPEPATEPETEAVLSAGPELTVYVAGAGDQGDIDACIGAIDHLGEGLTLGEHNYCGGDRYHVLDVGDTVALTGAYDATCTVSRIYDSHVGSTDYDTALHLQTSLGGGAVRLWRIDC